MTASRMLELKRTYALRGLLGAFGAGTIAWCGPVASGPSSVSLDPGASSALRLVPAVGACASALSVGPIEQHDAATSPLVPSLAWHVHLRGGHREYPVGGREGGVVVVMFFKYRYYVVKSLVLLCT